MTFSLGVVVLDRSNMMYQYPLGAVVLTSILRTTQSKIEI